MNIIASLAIALAAGLVFNRIVKKIGLPNVTGYLVAGLLIGPSVSGIINSENLASLDIITTVALGFIAFSIGGEFKASNIKKIGPAALTITFFEAPVAVLIVDLVLLTIGRRFGVSPAMAITLGAIAAATAPAATLMVVRQYKAKGPVTNILLPVVALDDAVGLVVFSVSFSIAKLLLAGDKLSAAQMIVWPLIEVAASLAAGAVLGIILTYCVRFFHSKENRLILALTAVVVSVAVSQITFFGHNFSSLLLCMAVGATFANLCNEYDGILTEVERWTPILYLLFFVVSGAELRLDVLTKVGACGALYIVFRSIGKYLGARLGAACTKQGETVRKYLGFTLLPQAGVAIGMSNMVVGYFRGSDATLGAEIQAVVLCATLVYELFGPLITKMSLKKAGEIQ